MNSAAPVGIAFTLIVMAFTAFLVVTVLAVPTAPGGLTQEVADGMEDHGVGHGVTAVLLDFRAYDTWLEVGVLLLALLGVFALRRSQTFPDPGTPPSPLLSATACILAPIALVIAGHLLWQGTQGPGGAFQAGAVLGATIILLGLAGWSPLARLGAVPMRSGILIGFMVFLLFALVSAHPDIGFLTHRPGMAYLGIVLIELGIAVATGLTLAALYLSAARPVPSQEAD